jgi:hypothetical protein
MSDNLIINIVGILVIIIEGYNIHTRGSEEGPHIQYRVGCLGILTGILIMSIYFRGFV